MRVLLAVIIALFITFQGLLPVCAEAPFLAIYTSYDFVIGWKKYFTKRHIDLLYPSGNFNEFDKFLKVVRQEAGTRAIIIDLSVHGSDTSGLLCTTTNGRKWGYCNLGYIVNRIRANLHEEKVTLVLEACYAPTVFMKGLRTFISFHGKDAVTEVYEGDLPFPIYGLAVSEPSYCRLALEDYLHKKHQVVIDLRKYDDPYELIPHQDLLDQNKLLLLLDQYEDIFSRI